MLLTRARKLSCAIFIKGPTYGHHCWLIPVCGALRFDALCILSVGIVASTADAKECENYCSRQIPVMYVFHRMII